MSRWRETAARAARWCVSVGYEAGCLGFILPVRFYQRCLRPFLPAVCRFHPSCSEYFILAVRKYGPLIGPCKGVWRICRCGPWHPGGYDPP